MAKLRLRTKFLLSTLLISAALTSASLLVVRRVVQGQVKKTLVSDLEDSFTTFQSFQKQREAMLTRSSELLADLPSLRALMTTQHEATIEDASVDFWRLGGSDLFALADRSGHIAALHTTTSGFTRAMAQESFGEALGQEDSRHWWFGGQHLYEVFFRPIYFGPAAENHLLGYLAVGYEIDDRAAAEMGRVASSQVAFFVGQQKVTTTLTHAQEADLVRMPEASLLSSGNSGQAVRLADEHFLASSLDLGKSGGSPVRVVALKSYDQATEFLGSLNHLLLALGLVAVLGGSLLVFLISHTFTRPLGRLVQGVRALERGDFQYRLESGGGDEVAELSGAFDRMRNSLRSTQQSLLETERLATIGRMASSISHDLRHSLAAIVANAEFLCEGELTEDQREDLYQEVRIAVNQMTDLIDSLLEFSRTRESLRPSYGDVRDTVERVVQVIRTHPEYQPHQITVSSSGNTAGWFDPRKLERALHNLLFNACEIVPASGGRVGVVLREIANGLEIRVMDNGPGIPVEIRTTLFEPFVSHGKENGTGLGLTVVQKIVQDHGGEVSVESTSPAGTVFKIILPLAIAPGRGEVAATKSLIARSEKK